MRNLLPLHPKELALFRQSNYSLCNQNVIGWIGSRTEIFRSHFYPSCVSEWNEIDSETRLVPYVVVFENNTLSTIHIPAKTIVGIHDPKGLPPLSQIRLGLIKLNFYRFKHFFQANSNTICLMNDFIDENGTLSVALPFILHSTTRFSRWSYEFVTTILWKLPNFQSIISLAVYHLVM